MMKGNKRPQTCHSRLGKRSSGTSNGGIDNLNYQYSMFSKICKSGSSPVNGPRKALKRPVPQERAQERPEGKIEGTVAFLKAIYPLGLPRFRQKGSKVIITENKGNSEACLCLLPQAGQCRLNPLTPMVHS